MHGMHSESARNAGLLPWNAWNALGISSECWTASLECMDCTRNQLSAWNADLECMDCTRNQLGMLECYLGMHGMRSESAWNAGMQSWNAWNALGISSQPGMLTWNAWNPLGISLECRNAVLECMECTRNQLGMLECCLGMHGMHSESALSLEC